MNGSNLEFRQDVSGRDQQSHPLVDEESDLSSLVRVMVIDDSKTIRKTAETLLKNAGYKVETATDGFDALAKIANFCPDIIFTDIMMPRLDGYQTCALIKNHWQYNTIPLVLLSSRDGLFDRAKGKVVGADDFLSKPFGKDDVLELIVRHCGKSSDRIRHPADSE